MNEISKDHLFGVCKPGQTDCCKYVMVGGKGFECAKNAGLEGFKRTIEQRTDMRATGDNCDGWEVVNASVC